MWGMVRAAQASGLAGGGAARRPHHASGYVSFALVLLWALPPLLAGSRGFFRIHDVLDSELLHHALVARSDFALATDGTVSGILGGIPRSCLPSGWSVTVALLRLLPPFEAYAVVQALVRALGWIGMWRLCTRHLCLPRQTCAAAAFVFATLPVSPIFGLTVLGQPLLVDAWLEVRRPGKLLWPLLCFGLFPLWSKLVLSGVFLVAGFGGWWLWERLAMGRRNGQGLLLLAALVLGYVFVEQALLFSFLAPTVQWHRLEFDPAGWSYNLAGVLRFAVGLLLDGQEHAALGYGPLGWLAMVVCVAPITTLAWSPRHGHLARRLATISIALCAVAALLHWDGLLGLKYRWALLRTFQLDRVYFLLPALLVVVFAVASGAALDRGARWAPFGLWTVVALQTLFSLRLSPELAADGGEIVGLAGPSRQGGIARGDAWLSVDLFSHLYATLQPRGRVISIGIDPLVPVWSGFAALDGYQQVYPLQWKHAFRRIIASELAKSAKLRTYFDGWGSRCVVPIADDARPDYDVDLDFGEVAALGGEYVFAGKPLTARAARSLTFVGHYAERTALWDVWVYRIPSFKPDA